LPENKFYDIILKSFLVLLTLSLLKFHGFFSVLRPSISSIFFLFISLAIIILSYIYLGNKLSSLDVILASNNHGYFLVKCLLTGIFEELLFRIFVFYYLVKLAGDLYSKSLIKVIWYSSVIFGLAHVSNFFNSEISKINVLSDINQILIAIFIGMLLQCIYIRLKSILLIITLHFVVNYFGSYRTYLLEPDFAAIANGYSLSDVFISLIIIIILGTVLVIPTSYLLIRKKLRENGVINSAI
jgi:membrane protease YdiL (CAAX protease family)